jgi:hypothetical protein
MVAVKERIIAQLKSGVLSSDTAPQTDRSPSPQISKPQSRRRHCKFEGSTVIDNAAHGASVDSDLAFVPHPSCWKYISGVCATKAYSSYLR